MHYDAFVRREGKHVLAEFPDCPGCQTFADSGDELAGAAKEALEGWLEAHLVGRQVPPRPGEHSRAPVGAKLARVPVRAGLAAALGVRWARHDAGLTQAELGKRAGVTQQQIAKVEDPDENPSLETLEKIAHALGRGVDVALESIPPAPRLAAGR
jgi:DNA-binding XRE family transcriptional regulator/predicted RNase H-like HicB family nuclease